MKRNDENNYTLKEAFASSPDLPESLSKERMVEMLKEKNITPKKKVKILPKIASLAAVLVVTLICMNAYHLIPVELQDVEPSYETQEVTYPVIENTVKPHTLKKADSNAELKKHIESLFERGSYNYAIQLFGDKIASDDVVDEFVYEINGTKAPTMAPGSAVGTAPTQSAVNEESDELKGQDFSVNDTLTGSNSKEHGQTNIQVEGIDEADIIKNDGRYLYIVSSGIKTDTRLKIVDTETMTLLYDEFIKGEKDNVLGIRDIYVNGDILVANCIESGYDNKTYVAADSVYTPGYNPWRSDTVNVVFDISERSSPKEIRRVSQNGSLLSSRMNGSILYTVTYYTVYNDTLEENYMPKVNGEFIGCDCVYIYDEKSTGYTVVTAFDTKEKNGEVSKASVLGSGAEVYCTSDTLYVGMYEYKNSETKTNIFAFSLDGVNVAYKASGAVKGQFLNQFCFDEHKDCLRVATNYYDYKTDKDISSIYVLNKDLQLIGKLEDLAYDEQIKSVRFMGDTGYVVTFRNTDPLFTLDLTDPATPKVLGEIKLPGYSAYLHPIGDGYMVGIGYDGDEENAKFNTVKVSVFDVTDLRNPKETDTFVIKEAETDVNYEPKAFISSKTMGFIGIPVKHYSPEGYYSVLSYKIIKIENGKILSHEGFTHPDENHRYGYGLFRGTFIGEKLYTVNLNTVAEHSLTSGELLRTVDILGDYDENADTSQTAPVNYNSDVVMKTTAAPGVTSAMTEPEKQPDTEIAVEAEVVEKGKLF
ncbi:MAG: beta-propeller domain-containing protein [Clostridia bacterium]|nr:beta-propeller domain-containing protein [Clostridia bacterium]